MDSLTRRSFMKTSAAGAGAAASILLGTSKTSWAGANDRVRIAVMGINGRGRSHLGGFSKLKNVEIAAICDVDSRLFPAVVKDLTKNGKAPRTEQDIRVLLEDPDIDAISIATPNHWHSLATIWACQAGKDVYVEKPMTHNIFEGRKVVEAAAKYNRIVQHGTQLRSNPGFQEGINELKNGLIGDVYMARCVCYKWRPDIGKGHPGNPPEGLDWNLWQGPAQEEPFFVNDKGEGIYVHYFWHWVWAYGNGDIGNQGVHQLDAARWGLGVNVPYRVTSMGGMFLWDDAKEIYNVSSTSFMFKGEDNKDKMVTLEVRPWCTNDEAGGTSFGVIFYGSEGWMTFPGYGTYKAYLGKDNKLVKEGNDGNDRYHYQNFIDCVRSRDASKLNAPPIEGHYSSALSHYALTGARVNRVLEIDTAAEQAVNDDEANAMLTRKYREPFVVPEVV
ncbi:MAG TPA: Gfo/Idh/MocA family oxidoreductase [Candidatus Hydrogenedentes bacterium]|nr:MAG: Alpha-N-acetylgalactosaminidase [Candidatus Hydrogenedentes bacterium ADurb.Bin170]HNZ48253.1 Gfo/Idh/MocA family oxidoreductase [Candidatus Hydrogenedentota bacterium]HOD95059.1 Gfo/Idh/MocA family oxidoreductase [Candidatus Hydrogenedentota bacterium]HOM47337.1 Gfo/Idh/MocA family oxidoreductase [Candidatus Hydrogenedentota bacterium]HOR50455.1 Gfo/Idh/MocA family oxidoreductase [Candidatus Hydrogenedentota bacterium]